MDAELKAHLESEIRRYRLAQSDMEQAVAAAQWIPAHQGTMRRLLETALAVTYARPFTDGLAIDRHGKGAPPDPGERGIHDGLIVLRNSLNAHIDDTPDRGVVDTREMFGAAATTSLSSGRR